MTASTAPSGPVYLAFPPVQSVAGTVLVPASKSSTNRALLLAGMSEREVEVVRPLDSADTRSLLRCLEALGVSIRPTPDGLALRGPLGGRGGDEVVLDAGDSGTAARFLAAAAAATPGRYLLTGSPRLRQRPVGELVTALVSAGASIAFGGEAGCLPLQIEGKRLRSGTVDVDASRSSQFVSALLLAAIAVEGGLEVRPRGPIASPPYVRTTLETLAAFGHRVSAGPALSAARGDAGVARYTPTGDYSSALPLLAAAGAAGGSVRVQGLAWPSHDADAQALPALESLGLSLQRFASAVVASPRPGESRGAEIAAGDFPDAVPALAALAAFREGETRFRGIGHLRYKESDRIAALVTVLSLAGAEAESEPDALVVRGPIRRRAEGVVRLPSFDDHRIAMASGILSLRVPGLLIENPGCVAKSYPNFFRDLQSISVR